MNKNTCVIYAPIDCYSGYSSNSRDKIKSIIELKGEEWDIKIISCPWGNTTSGFIEDHKEEWGFLNSYILNEPLNYQPDYMFWITIPSEAQRIGRWNCLITAGIETTICSPQWLEGCNRMDLIIVPSEHSKKVFESTKYKVGDDQKVLELNTPIEVIFEGADLKIYDPKKKKFKNESLFNTIDSIPNKNVFLFVGHWLKGDFGEDRKNVGLLVKSFYETFKKEKNPPALLLKTSCGKGSYMDRREIMNRINSLKKTSKSSKPLPNVYLLHGDINDEDICEIYNHPKIKTMVSLTKGEGFGRPLLEFSFTGKPIMVSGFSGHLDFLNPSTSALIGGSLTPIHPTAQEKEMLIEGSQWFSVDHGQVGHFFLDIFKNYKTWEVKGKKQGKHNRDRFNKEKMTSKLGDVFNQHIIKLPSIVQLKLPTLPSIKNQLPKLTKIT